MRAQVAWLGLALIGLVACASPASPAPSARGPATPQTTGAREFTVLMGPDNDSTQLNAYFPGSMTARPGDTIVFENRSIAPHTITFGLEPDPLTWPPLASPAGQPNPVATAPCATDQVPATSCTNDPAAPLPAFSGRGLWSSGVLPPDAPDVPAVARTVRVALSEDITPGLYTYVCLIHPSMAGTVEVVDPGSGTLSPAEIAQSGLQAQARALSAAADMSPPEPPAAVTGPTIYVGWGDGIASVNQFSPAQVTVPVGTNVSWTIGSPAEGHFITFGQPSFSSFDDPAFLFPAGVAPGGEYAGGLAHSGLISMDPRFPATSYTLRFTQPGTYHYVCPIHPGMDGDIVVTP